MTSTFDGSSGSGGEGCCSIRLKENGIFQKFIVISGTLTNDFGEIMLETLFTLTKYYLEGDPV